MVFSSFHSLIILFPYLCRDEWVALSCLCSFEYHYSKLQGAGISPFIIHSILSPLDFSDCFFIDEVLVRMGVILSLLHICIFGRLVIDQFHHSFDKHAPEDHSNLSSYYSPRLLPLSS